MAGKPYAKVRWWRWRRNALRRHVDIVEAWLILVAWLCAVAGALVAGVASGVASADNLERQRAEQQPVHAVVLQDARAHVAGRGAGSVPVSVSVRWTGPDGTQHTGQTRVKPGTPAGTKITAWADTQNRLTTKPLSFAAAILQATATGTLAAACAASAVLVSAWAVHWQLDSRRLRQWDKEWEQVDAQWRGKTV